MKMEPTVSSETSAVRTQAPGNYPKRNKLHLEHGESLKTSNFYYLSFFSPHGACLEYSEIQFYVNHEGISNFILYTSYNCNEISTSSRSWNLRT